MLTKMVKEWFSKENLKNALPILMLATGAIFFVMSIDCSDWSWKELWRFLSELLIIGVLFSFVANAGLFSKVFNTELQNIIYGKDFIGNRADLEVVWGNLSQELCRNKFKNISADLLNAIKSYFPADAVSYFDNYNLDLRVEWVDKRSGQVRVTQDLHTRIIAESTARFPSPFKATTPKGCNCDVKVTKLTVNGKIADQATNTDFTEAGETVYKHEILLEGNTQYDIHFVRERTYSIYQDNYIGFRASHIINGMTVRLTLPEGISAEYLSRGTLSEFTDLRNTENCIEKQYDGIILPNQGYIFILKTKKN